jgi:hypothetical protein
MKNLYQFIGDSTWKNIHIFFPICGCVCFPPHPYFHCLYFGIFFVLFFHMGYQVETINYFLRNKLLTSTIIFMEKTIFDPYFNIHSMQNLTHISALNQCTFGGCFLHSFNVVFNCYFCSVNASFGVVFYTILRIHFFYICGFLLVFSWSKKYSCMVLLIL